MGNKTSSCGMLKNLTSIKRRSNIAYIEYTISSKNFLVFFLQFQRFKRRRKFDVYFQTFETFFILN